LKATIPLGGRLGDPDIDHGPMLGLMMVGS
jgi:hypothetical protein